MNKMKIPIYLYSAFFFVAHLSNAYVQDISLIVIPDRKLQSINPIRELSIPAIPSRDIPAGSFQITNCFMLNAAHVVDPPDTSFTVLSTWQIDMNALPKKELGVAFHALPTPTLERLSHNFLELESSFPNVAAWSNREILLKPRRINSFHYLIEYNPFFPSQVYNKCIPSIQCSPSQVDKEESEKPAPSLSLVSCFSVETPKLVVLSTLPASEPIPVSYSIFDQNTIKSSTCFSRIKSSIDSIQSISLTDNLQIQPFCNELPMNRYPKIELPLFSKKMQLAMKVILPKIHTLISNYIPNDLEDISGIKQQVSQPMTFIGPFHYMENFALLPNLEDLRTLSYREEFTSVVNAMPSSTGEYYFSITLTPNHQIAFPPIPQTIFFLIDRSSHITSEQFNSFKRGVIRSLPYIPENSRFNIAFFDEKVSYLHSVDLEKDAESIHRADAFVRSGNKKILFGNSNIDSVLDSAQNEALLNSHTTYILLTNRKSLQSTENSKLLSNFIRDHREICTLYLASIGDNLTDILEVEESVYSDTHATFPRRLATLVKNLSFPIANHLKVSAITEDPNLHIELFPNSSVIHQDKPFVIYGKTDQLKSFQLILQGNNLNSWINITKPIAFNVPMHSTKTLAKHFNKLEKSNL